MKLWKPLITLCIITMLATAATAQTEKTLPSEKDIKTLCESVTDKDNYASTLFESAKEKGYVCDLWTCETCTGEKLAISFYYPADNKNGYKSIYTSQPGEYRSSIPNLELKESYTGEEQTEESDSEDEVKDSQQEVTDESDNVFSIKSEGDDEKEEKLDEFMEYFENKDSVSLEEIRAHADDVFYGDDE